MGLKKDDFETMRKEVREAIDIESHTITEEAKIFFDGKQYAVRIGINIARTLQLNTDMDRIRWMVKIEKDISKKPHLIGELLRGVA